MPFTPPEEQGGTQEWADVVAALPERLGSGGKVPPWSSCPPCASLAGSRFGSEQMNHGLAFSLSQITKLEATHIAELSRNNLSRLHQALSTSGVFPSDLLS